MAKRDLWLDFNGVDDDWRAHSLVDYLSDGVTVDVGSHVIVGDDEGNRCRAVVVSVDASTGVIELTLQGETFESALIEGQTEDAAALSA